MESYNLSDIVAQSFINIDFPAQYVAMLKTPGLENIGISKFYEAFCNKNEIPIHQSSNVIFTPALILGHLYVTFLNKILLAISFYFY